jgi:hypothetical protein
MPGGYLTKLVTLIVPDAKAEREARLSESIFMMTIVVVINTAQADLTVGRRAPAEDAPGLMSCSGYLRAKCRSGWRVAAALFSHSAKCPSGCSGTARQGQTTPAAAAAPASTATMRGPPSAPTASLAASTLIAFSACRRGDGGQRQDQGCTGR